MQRIVAEPAHARRASHGTGRAPRGRSLRRRLTCASVVACAPCAGLHVWSRLLRHAGGERPDRTSWRAAGRSRVSGRSGDAADDARSARARRRGARIRRSRELGLPDGKQLPQVSRTSGGRTSCGTWSRRPSSPSRRGAGASRWRAASPTAGISTRPARRRLALEAGGARRRRDRGRRRRRTRRSVTCRIRCSSTMLGWRETRLVGTIFHELAHERLYVAGRQRIQRGLRERRRGRGRAPLVHGAGRTARFDAYEPRRAREAEFVGAAARRAAPACERSTRRACRRELMRIEKQREFGRLKFDYR